MRGRISVGSTVIGMAVLVGVALLTLAMFAWMGYDLSKLSTVVAGDRKDAITFVYHLYQSYDNLAHRPLNLGYALVFHNPQDPAPFAYTIAPYGIALTALPFYLLSGANLILTTNLYIILTFVLTAGSGFLLVRYVCKVPRVPAWVIGLFIAFAPVRVLHLQLSHPEILSLQWLLFSLYFLHRLLDAPRWKWAIGLALTIWLDFISSAYLGYFFVIYAAILIVYLLITQRDLLARSLLIKGAAALALAVILMIPFYGFRFQNSAFSEGHPFSEIEFLSDRPLNWLQGTSFIYYKLNGYEVEEKAVFLGFVPLILALIAWRLRRDEPLIPFLFIVITIAYLLTLGPTMALGNGDAIPAPFVLLMQFPGANSIRQVPRFVLLALIGVALLIGFVFARLFVRVKRVSALIVLGVATLLLAFEAIPYNGLLGGARTDNTYHLSAQPIPAFDLGGQTPFVAQDLNAWLAQQPPDTPVFDYPVDDASNQQYMFSLIYNHQPMLNGQTSFYPDWYRDRDWNRFPSVYTLYALRQYGIQYAMIYKPFLNGDQINDVHTRLAQFSDQLKQVNELDGVEVYQVLPLVPSDPPAPRFEFDEFAPGTGWFSPEKNDAGVTFDWTQTPVSTLVLPPLTADKPRVFTAQLYGGADPAVLNSLQFYVNDVEVELTASQNDGVTILKGNISASAFAGDALTLKFVTIPYASPVVRGVGGDSRNLGIAFDWIQVSGVN